MLNCIVKVCLFSKKLLNCLPKWLYYFVFPPVIKECASCFTFSTAFCVGSMLNFGYFNRCAILTIFFPVCALSSHYFNSVIGTAKFYNFKETKLIYFSFMDLAFNVVSKKPLSNPRSSRCSPMLYF